MKKGIYTLANDVVFDQLVALLNSIRANYSKDIPVCVIPYDDRMDKVKEEIKTRKNVFIFEDGKCIKKWEALGKKIWDVYSKDMPENQNIFGRHSIHLHRKFCIFDGPFEEFAFLDADTLIMNSIEPFFKKLKTKKFISYDYQYTDLSHVYNINSKKLFEIFNQNRINSEIFCVGFFVSKKTLFSPKDIKKIMRDIKEEYDILYSRAPEQSLLNYMIMKLNIKNYNFALELPKEKHKFFHE